MLYAVSYGSATVSEISRTTNKVVATLIVGDHPQAVDALHSRIYVANVHDDSITAISGETNEVIGTFSAEKNPYALARPNSGAGLRSRLSATSFTVVNASQAAAH